MAAQIAPLTRDVVNAMAVSSAATVKSAPRTCRPFG